MIGRIVMRYAVPRAANSGKRRAGTTPNLQAEKPALGTTAPRIAGALRDSQARPACCLILIRRSAISLSAVSGEVKYNQSTALEVENPQPIGDIFDRLG